MIAVTQESPEVFYAADPLAVVGADEIDFLKARARENPRRRARLCVHSGVEDTFQEMIIVHHRDCYVRPHCHREKTESLHVIEGSADAVVFHDDGGVATAFALAPSLHRAPFYYRMPPRRFHTLLIASEWFVFHEAVRGPFVREETGFPAWAPDGTDERDVTAYVAELRERLARAAVSPG